MAKSANSAATATSPAEVATIVSGAEDHEAAKQYGRPILEFLGDEEPSNDPSEIFDVQGLIVHGEPSLFIGDPKVGKTMLVEDLMLHVAAGRREWCGLQIYRRCRVLLFLREDSERTSQRRLWQLARGAGIEHWELDGHLAVEVAKPLYFDDPKNVVTLKGQLGEFDVCAIDSLSTIHNGDENSVERMAPIMNAWRDLALATTTAIPLVHHFRKGNENSNGSGGGVLQRARGSSLIGATTRHAVGVEKGPSDHQVVLRVESNHEVDLEPLVIRRRFGIEGSAATIRHERVGSVGDAIDARDVDRLDPLVLAVVRESGFEGIGAKALRSEVRDRLIAGGASGCRPQRIDQAAKRLADRGTLTRDGDRGHWKWSR